MEKRFVAILFFVSALIFFGCNSTKKVQDYILAGEIDKAKEFFTNKADINEVDSNGNTALHIAAKMNEPDLITFLVVKGADTELKNNDGDTPLHVAVNVDAYESARVLTSLGADIFALDAKGKSALETSLAQGEIYYDIMINEKTSQLRDVNNGNGIVHYFVLTRNKKAIDFCVNKQLNIDKKNFAGNTPLALALENPDTLVAAEIAASLVLAGAEEVDCDAKYFEHALSQRNLSIRMNDGQTPLHLAAIYGHSGIAQYLLKNGADTSAQDISGTTPLHEAVRYGNVEIVKSLIANGANVNGQDSLGKTPLLVLIPLEYQDEIYSLLLASGANANHKDMYGDSILHTAAMTALENSLLEKFVRAGADVNVRNKKGLTPIGVSIEHNNAAQLKFFVEHGADIHAEDAKKITPLVSVLLRKDDMYKSLIIKKTVATVDSEGNTPLIIALKRNIPYERIEYILSLGADVNARNRNGESALYIAVEKNNRSVGELLLSCGADIFAANTKNVSPLRLALENENGIEEWFLNSKTISKRDGSGNTVLHFASEWKLPKSTFEFLIQKGCDVNATNGNGETPLFSAAKADNPNSIDVLVQNGAAVNARDNLGSTALHMAVRWNAISAAESLLNLGFDVNSQNVGGKTALDEAAVEGNVVMAKMLLSRGADPNVYDMNGNNSLFGAIRANHFDMVKLLLGAKANPQSQDLNGRSAYHEAAILGDKDTIVLLRSFGANPLARDKAGKTPLSIAFGQEREIMYAILGSDKMIADSDGNTPVHIAIQEKVGVPILKSLIENGFPFDSRNSSGYTPLSVAISQNQKDAAELLLEKGANPFSEINSKGENSVSLSFKDSSGELLGFIVKYASKKTDVRGNTILHYAARLADDKTVRRLLDLGLDKNAKNVSGETPYDVAVNWKKNSNAALLK